MYPIAVVGNNATARAAIAACHKAGLHDISWFDGPAAGRHDEACTLPANITRVLNALDCAAALQEFGHAPDRQQVRLARSGFLVSELPLGNFSRERYGAPHVNVEDADWPDILPLADVSLAAQAPLSTLEQDNKAVLVCTADAFGEQPAATHSLWHAVLAFDAPVARANITWVGQRQCAWQFSTPSNQHVYFSTPLDQPPAAADWHPMLHDAVQAVQHRRDFCVFQPQVREHWHAGSVAYLGAACSPGNPYLREAAAMGIEDAWVLGRMLENYEEDIQDGFQEYEKYRRARTRRVVKAAAKSAEQMNHAGVAARFFQHLNVALSTRFLPEIAMHRVDWFYSYDCIRGFR